MTVPDEFPTTKALQDRLARMGERLKERFEQFEKRVGKLEEAMADIAEMPGRLRGVADLITNGLTAIEALTGRVAAVEGLVTDIMRMHTEQGEATLAALGALSERMDLMDKCPSAPDEELRTTHAMQDGTMVLVGDGPSRWRGTVSEAGPTVPAEERTFRCLSCGQRSPHKKVLFPGEQKGWECKYCEGTTFYAGENKA